MRKLAVWSSAMFGLGMAHTASLGNCPVGIPYEIFCDDFDTYCSESSGGHPGDSHCPTAIGSATRVDQRLKEVWLREPRAEDGTEMIVEEDQKRLWSAPFGGRYPCQGEARYGTMTSRDWLHSPYPLSADGQIRNLAWRVEDVFGATNTAVVGTDDQPLILRFMMDGGGSGKIHWGNGFVEVTLDDGNENSRSDRANTDYADSPDCNTYCDPYIQLEPMPILCAQGNPDTSTAPMPAACPDVTTHPPPIRQSIAVGALGMLDTDPCHCGSTMAHGPVNYHLNVYDGQKWWMLRSNNPQPGTGFVTDKYGNLVNPPYPAGLNTPGHFVLYGGSSKNVKSHNFVTLTIKSDTFDVHLATFELDTAGNRHFVHSDMTGLPRAYLGAFNALRVGVGQGCQIRGTPNNPWACGGSNTHPLRSRANGAGAIVFDELFIHGGAPIVEEGACCHPDGTCTEVLADQCDGLFRGRSTFCATLTEPCCPAIYGDTDADGDVDLADFGELQRCLTPTGPISADSCRCLDFDSNRTIDSVDVEHFIRCASGPEMPGSSAPPCQGVGW